MIISPYFYQIPNPNSKHIVKCLFSVTFKPSKPFKSIFIYKPRHPDSNYDEICCTSPRPAMLRFQHRKRRKSKNGKDSIFCHHFITRSYTYMLIKKSLKQHIIALNRRTLVFYIVIIVNP